MRIDTPFGLDPSVIQRLSAVFQRDERIQKVLIFGSRATDSFRRGSDIDLAVFGPSLSLKDVLALATVIDDLMLPYRVDLALYTELENIDLRKHIDLVGKVFFQRHQ